MRSDGGCLSPHNFGVCYVFVVNCVFLLSYVILVRYPKEHMFGDKYRLSCVHPFLTINTVWLDTLVAGA